MTNEEVVTRNIGLAFDFLRYVLDCPQILDDVPDGAELELLASDVPIPEKGQEDHPRAVFTSRRVFESLHTM